MKLNYFWWTTTSVNYFCWTTALLLDCCTSVDYFFDYFVYYFRAPFEKSITATCELLLLEITSVGLDLLLL